MGTPPISASTDADQKTFNPHKPSLEENLVSAAGVMVPLTGFMYAHHRGLTVKMLNLVYNRVGVYGFLALPLMTICMEKSVYDSIRCLQGYNPNEIRESRKGEPWPSGGAAMLPSLSFFPGV